MHFSYDVAGCTEMKQRPTSFGCACAALARHLNYWAAALGGIEHSGYWVEQIVDVQTRGPQATGLGKRSFYGRPRVQSAQHLKRRSSMGSPVEVFLC